MSGHQTQLTMFMLNLHQIHKNDESFGKDESFRQAHHFTVIIITHFL